MNSLLRAIPDTYCIVFWRMSEEPWRSVVWYQCFFSVISLITRMHMRRFENNILVEQNLVPKILYQLLGYDFQSYPHQWRRCLSRGTIEGHKSTHKTTTKDQGPEAPVLSGMYCPSLLVQIGVSMFRRSLTHGSLDRTVMRLCGTHLKAGWYGACAVSPQRMLYRLTP